MTHSQKVKVTGLLILAVMSIGVFVFTPLSAFWTHMNAHAASSLPYHEFADGPYSVKGNTIVGTDGKQYLFHGVGRDSLEFDCSGDGFLDAAEAHDSEELHQEISAQVPPPSQFFIFRCRMGP